MADSSEPAFLFLYRKEAVAPVDYLSTFATAPPFSGKEHNIGTYILDRTGQISGTVRDYHRPSKGVGSSRTSGLYLSGGLWISEKYIIHGQGGHRHLGRQ